MNTVIARVIKILTGKSPTSRVDLRDEFGNEHKLEVPTKTIADFVPGRVLILQWSVHDVPAFEEPPQPAQPSGPPPKPPEQGPGWRPQPQPEQPSGPPPKPPEQGHGPPDRGAEDPAGAADNPGNAAFFRMIGLS